MEKSIHGGDQLVLQTVLRQAREAAGLRQEDLARRLNKPQSFVSKYESGERRLDILELRLVCHVMGISFTSFAETLERRIKDGIS